MPACGLEAGSRLAVVASPVHTGRDSGGGLPGAPCRCALCVQATADRPPPVSRTRLRSLFRRLPLEAPADIRRRSGHISLSASLGQSAGAGRPHTNRPCFRHRPPPTRRVPRPPGAPPAQLAAAAPVPAWSSPLRTAEDGEAGHGGSASGGAAGKRDSRQSTSIRAPAMRSGPIPRIFRSRCSCVVYYVHNSATRQRCNPKPFGFNKNPRFPPHARGMANGKGQQRAILHSPAGAVDVVVVGAGVRLMYSMQNLNARLRG